MPDIFDEEIPDGDTPDNLLADLMAEFGDGSKPQTKKSKAQQVPTYFPPAPKWVPAAIALRTVVQHCAACGEEHTYTQGVFLEAHAVGTTAIRYTPFQSEGNSEAVNALPRRKDITHEHTNECATCFGIEEQLLGAFGSRATPQLTLNLGE